MCGMWLQDDVRGVCGGPTRALTQHLEHLVLSGGEMPLGAEDEGTDMDHGPVAQDFATKETVRGVDELVWLST